MTTSIKKRTLKAIKDTFTLGDLVRNIPCEVPFCEEKRTIETGAGNVCEKHAIQLAERTL